MWTVDDDEAEAGGMTGARDDMVVLEAGTVLLDEAIRGCAVGKCVCDKCW